MLFLLLFSHKVMSNSLWPHGLQHARSPCPSPSPRAYSNSCPLTRWCHPTIPSSVVLFSSCLQSFPALESFPMSRLSLTDGKSIGVSASASVLPMNNQDWFPLGLTGLISLLSKELPRVFSNTTFQKYQFHRVQLSLWSNLLIHTLVQFSRSVVSNSLQPHGLQHTRLPCPSPTPETYSKSSIKSVMPSNRLILCCPLLLLPSIFSSIRVFSNESVLHIRWPNYWSFTFSISPSNECSWLVSFRIDWLDLLAVQVTLKILLQHHSSEA